MRLLRTLVDRLVPALLIALSVSLLSAGLLSYGTLTALSDASLPPEVGGASIDPASPNQTDEPRASDWWIARPSTSPSVTSPPPVDPADPGGSPSPTVANPSSSPVPTVSAQPRAAAPTRIVIASERIDLPIISGDTRIRGQGPNGYPLCDVAQYLTFFGFPGEEGATYLYAHARTGMFLPLLEASQRRNGARLLGSLVEVYTDDDQLHLYEIVRVKRHATDFTLATDLRPGEQRLILQTSEGPRGTIPKLQVAAVPIGVVPADPDEAHPDPKPRTCYN